MSILVVGCTDVLGRVLDLRLAPAVLGLMIAVFALYSTAVTAAEARHQRAGHRRQERS